MNNQETLRSLASDSSSGSFQESRSSNTGSPNQDPYPGLVDKLKSFLNNAPSPAFLTTRLQTSAEDERRGRRRYFLIAASAVVALVLGAGVTWSHHKSYRLPMTMLELVLAEPNLFDKTYMSNPQSLAERLGRVGLTSAVSLPIIEAREAKVPGGGGTHLVVETPYGRAVVTVMPNKPVHGERRVVRRGLIAVVRPDGKGSYSVVAETDKAIEAAETILRDRSMRRI